MNLHHAWSRTQTALRLLREARERHAAPYPGLVRRFIDVYGRRRYSLREIVKLDLLDPQREPAWFGCVAAPAREASPSAIAWLQEHAARVFETAEVDELIVKPAYGVYGRGVVALRRENGVLTDSCGVRRRPADVLEWLGTLCDYDRFVVQERVEGHEDLRRLSGTRNVQTVRMVTYVRRDGEPVIGGCQLKIIGADALVDNFESGRTGNMAGDIPAASGRLSTVHGAMPGGGSRLVDRHPRTGITFQEFTIPLWDQARALVQRAALAFAPLRTIGGDVAITPRGALLIRSAYIRALTTSLSGVTLPTVLRRWTRVQNPHSRASKSRSDIDSQSRMRRSAMGSESRLFQ